MNSLSLGQFSYKKDFLGCHLKKQVVNDLTRFGEGDTSDGEFFSDYVFVYNKKLKKKRVCFLVSKSFILIYDVSSWKVIFMNYLKCLDLVNISAKNCTQVSLHFSEGAEYLTLESYRRVEVIIYCARALKNRNYNLFKLKISKKFEGETKEQGNSAEKIRLPESLVRSGSSTTSYLQETLRNAKKSGFLRVFKKGGIFGRDSFVENFAVLGELGLILFKEYGVS